MSSQPIGRKSAFYWLLTAVTLIGLAFALDNPVERITSLNSMPHMRVFAHYMSLTGEGWVIAVVGCLSAAILAWRGRNTASRWVLIVALIGLTTGATATVLRSLIGRTRPNAGVEQGIYGVYHDSKLLIGKYEYNSFPSGHTATVFGLAAAAWFLNRRIGLLVFAYAALVSWSRIAQGSHHFSDVVAASLLGIFGAHLILSRWGPTLDAYSQRFQKALSRNRKSIAT